MPEDQQSDHDKLTTLVGAVANLDQKLTEKFDDLKEAINDLKEGTATRIADHETRLRRLELWGFMAIGGAYILAVLLKYIIKG